MKSTLILAVIGLVAVAAIPPAHAALYRWETYNGGNDHYYEPVLATGGWVAARDAAVARGGYLATVTSASENDFVYGLVTDPQYWVGEYAGPWLGGYQPAGSPEPAGGWTWVSGEAWTFSNWWPSQPDNSAGIEHHLQFHGGPLHGGPLWNDLPVDYSLAGYVIEYDDVPHDEVTADLDCTRYIVVWGRATWDQASADAASREWNGGTGHLATINSVEERDLLAGLLADEKYWLNDFGGPWVGGYQPAGSPEPDGGWAWVTGEAVNIDIVGWWPSQPDNSAGIEDHLHLHGGPNHGGLYYNDVTSSLRLISYVIEIPSLAQAVEPATWGDVKALFR